MIVAWLAWAVPSVWPHAARSRLSLLAWQETAATQERSPVLDYSEGNGRDWKDHCSVEVAP